MIRSGSRAELARVVIARAPVLSYDVVLRALLALRDAGRWAEVLAVYEAAVAVRGLADGFDVRVYTELFFCLMKLGKQVHARMAYREWCAIVDDGRENHLLGPRAFNFIFVLLSRSSMIDEAVEVRQCCSRCGYYLNRYSYNAFLNACAKSNRVSDAFETLREMAISKISPDVISFNVLISCCIRSGDLEMALGILERMRDWGIAPDIYSYNSVVNGLRKSRMLDSAFDLVARMEAEAEPLLAQHKRDGTTLTYVNEVGTDEVSSEGSDDHRHAQKQHRNYDGRAEHSMITSTTPLPSVAPEQSVRQMAPGFIGVSPDLVTYNTLISGVAGLDPPDLQRAFAVKRHMESRGILCNEVSYNALMAAAARSEHIEEAFGIYHEMLDRDIKPNCECFTTLITLCGRAKMLGRAFGVHEHMVTVGIKPSVVTFNALLSACRCSKDGGAGETAMSVLEAMRSVPGCKPDVITYSTIIDALGRSGRFSEIRAILNEMHEEEIEPNLVTYTSVISALTRAGDLEAAMQVLSDMDARGVKANVYTFSSLINGAGRSGDFARAFELLNMMRSRGIEPSCVTYVTLISVSMRAGSAKNVLRTVEELGTDRAKSDWEAYQQVLSISKDPRLFDPHFQQEVLEALLSAVRKTFPRGATKKRKGRKPADRL